MNVLNKHQ